MLCTYIKKYSPVSPLGAQKPEGHKGNDHIHYALRDMSAMELLWSQTTLTLSWWLTCAPFSNSSCTHVTWAHDAEPISGVHPYCKDRSICIIESTTNFTFNTQHCPIDIIYYYQYQYSSPICFTKWCSFISRQNSLLEGAGSYPLVVISTNSWTIHICPAAHSTHSTINGLLRRMVK